ncbi:unnamed protein product [Dovyalis caffra]|uniref:Uncharacterized protein n=1 Tax=Dovyalis caffra TaxID=77055 RepID=A0AAV1SR86_9ROSI|nr:unnamed protein product [Dovyalis caffra]
MAETVGEFGLEFNSPEKAEREREQCQVSSTSLLKLSSLRQPHVISPPRSLITQPTQFQDQEEPMTFGDLLASFPSDYGAARNNQRHFSSFVFPMAITLG